MKIELKIRGAKDWGSNAVLWLYWFGTTVLEIKNSMIVVVLIFLKHNDLCGRLVDSNYFYTVESTMCINFHVCVMLLVCTLCAVSEGLLQFAWQSKEFWRNCEDLICKCSEGMKVNGSYYYYCSSFKQSFDEINFPPIIFYTIKAKTFQQLLPTTMKRNYQKLIAKIT